MTFYLVVMIVPFVGSRASEHEFSYSNTNWAAIPMMFGISNSAFGCHETLPSLLFPISQKRHNFTMLALTFGGIMLLYFSLSTTALISFDGDLIADVYLLNFQVKTLGQDTLFRKQGVTGLGVLGKNFWHFVYPSMKMTSIAY